MKEDNKPEAAAIAPTCPEEFEESLKPTKGPSDKNIGNVGGPLVIQHRITD